MRNTRRNNRYLFNCKDRFDGINDFSEAENRIYRLIFLIVVVYILIRMDFYDIRLAIMSSGYCIKKKLHIGLGNHYLDNHAEELT